MADMFGAPNGISQALQDLQGTAQHNMNMQLDSVKLQEATLTLQRQQQMMKALQGAKLDAPPPTPYEQADAMDNMAKIALAAGDLDEGQKLASTATVIRNNTAKIQAGQIKGVATKLDVFQKVLATVHDEKSWQDAQQIYKQQTGEESPYKDVPYSPSVVEQIRTKSLTGLQQAQAMTAEARARYYDAQTGGVKVKEALEKSQIELNNTKRELYIKNGGTSAKKVQERSATRLQDLSAEIGNIYTDATASQRRAAALKTADAVDKYIDQGKTYSQALVMAVREVQSQGGYSDLTLSAVTRGQSFSSPVKVKGGDKDSISKETEKPNRFYDINGTTYWKSPVDGKFYSQEDLAEEAKKKPDSAAGKAWSASHDDLEEDDE